MMSGSSTASGSLSGKNVLCRHWANKVTALVGRVFGDSFDFCNPLGLLRDGV